MQQKRVGATKGAEEAAEMGRGAEKGGRGEAKGAGRGVRNIETQAQCWLKYGHTVQYSSMVKEMGNVWSRVCIHADM